MEQSSFESSVMPRSEKCDGNDCDSEFVSHGAEYSTCAYWKRRMRETNNAHFETNLNLSTLSRERDGIT